jgi:transposase, IS6 family
VTVYRWVLRCTALLADAATPCRHAVGRRWQVDETYVKVAGQWRYVYRAIDQFGQVIDVFVWHRTEQYANNRVEADHGRLKARLRPIRGLKQDRSARVIIAGHAFIQNIRRGHSEQAVEEPTNRRLVVAFDELVWRSDPSGRGDFSLPGPTQHNSAP